ncbi:MAG TPA: uroporphyrinogen decarboxylase family protein, partial [Acidobacteriaceae bacterium]|nr:uroporphyrinogen decarboxylase family protein [Acidobacteriaceae bacterium]
MSSASTSRFIRACLRQPVDRTPVWFLRQAGRYMPEYMAVRKHHSLLDICRTPSLAAEVTITAAERLGVDAAIIFADLLLPLTPMGLDFEFVNGEGPVIHHPLRTLDQIRALRTDRTPELSYVAEAITKVAAHFNNRASASSSAVASRALKGTGFSPAPALKGTSSPLKGTGFSPAPSLKGASSALKGTGFSPSVPPTPGSGALAPEGIFPENQDTLGIIGFCGAPFTLASYMIEGGSSRNYIETKKLMYASSTSGPRPSALGPEPGAPRLDSETWARGRDTNAASWPLLMDTLVTVLADFARQQVEAGADVIQVFDSWAGALSVADYRAYALAPTTELIRRIQALGVPVIYFGVDTA